MLIGTVVGHVWSTVKDPTLQGLRFLVIQPFTTDGRASSETIVAVDPLGAGIGERVLVVFGRAARHAIGRGHDIGFQTAVAAIIDRMELADGSSVGPIAARDQPGRAPSGQAPSAPTAAARGAQVRARKTK
jgi:ethanolamine utilization protein EutN